MTGTLSTLTLNLLIVALFVAVVFVGLRIAQSIFGTSSKKAAATEVAAKLVSYPTGSSAVLRRRFVRALTGQHVIMPSGERLAFSELTVRIAPEDVERLDPDGDLERLGDDGARLYADHAERTGWAVPRHVTVHVEIDPGLRSGWIPPARGSGRAEPARSESRVPQVGWDAVGAARTGATAGPPPPPVPAPVPAPAPAARPVVDPDATMNFPALVPALDDSSPTMNVVTGLRLERNGQSFPITGTEVVLGRLPESPVVLAEPEVSYRHAGIRRQGVSWQIKDLGSTNGTTVDGHRIDGEDWATLHAGSVIALAGVTIVAAMDASGTVHLKSLTTH